MQRTDSIFFISGIKKQICGRLSLNLLSQAQVTRNQIGEYWFTILTHSLIRETKQMQASIKKERLDNRSLKEAHNGFYKSLSVAATIMISNKCPIIAE